MNAPIILAPKAPSFSSGIGCYGIHFWLYERDTGRLISPAQDGGSCDFGLSPGGT